MEDAPGMEVTVRIESETEGSVSRTTDLEWLDYRKKMENSRAYLEIRRDQYSETQALRRTIECKALKARLSLNACLSRKKKFRCNPCRDCNIPVQLC